MCVTAFQRRIRARDPQKTRASHSALCSSLVILTTEVLIPNFRWFRGGNEEKT